MKGKGKEDELKLDDVRGKEDEVKVDDVRGKEEDEILYYNFCSRIVKNSVARINMDISMDNYNNNKNENNHEINHNINHERRKDRTARKADHDLFDSLRPNPMYRWFQFCERGIG